MGRCVRGQGEALWRDQHSLVVKDEVIVGRPRPTLVCAASW